MAVYLRSLIPLFALEPIVVQRLRTSKLFSWHIFSWHLLGWLAIICVSASTPVYASPQDDKEEVKTDAEPKSKPERPKIYDEQANAAEQIANATARAKRENKRVLIQWGANWCGWCHLLHDIMKKNGDIRNTVLYEYEVVLVDVGRFDKNQELIAKYEAPLDKQGLPFITVLDSEGKVVVQQETSSLETKDSKVQGHNAEAINEFLAKYKATPWNAQAILDSGMKQGSLDGHLVFLHFGAPWCGWCHHMERWMRQPEVASILEKAFVDIKIDNDRMEGADAIYDRYCKVKSGIPWFVFLNPTDGSVVASSDSDKGNVGFPSTEEEIEHFVAMLQSTKRLTEKDIQSLKESLVKNRIAREGK